MQGPTWFRFLARGVVFLAAGFLAAACFPAAFLAAGLLAGDFATGGVSTPGIVAIDAAASAAFVRPAFAVDFLSVSDGIAITGSMALSSSSLRWHMIL